MTIVLQTPTLTLTAQAQGARGRRPGRRHPRHQHAVGARPRRRRDEPRHGVGRRPAPSWRRARRQENLDATRFPPPRPPSRPRSRRRRCSAAATPEPHLPDRRAAAAHHHPGSAKQPGYRPVSLPMPTPISVEHRPNSLWQAGTRAFFKDQRATQVGDILTVVINFNEQAKLENETTRTRTGAENASATNLFGFEIAASRRSCRTMPNRRRCSTPTARAPRTATARSRAPIRSTSTSPCW